MTEHVTITVNDIAYPMPAAAWELATGLERSMVHQDVSYRHIDMLRRIATGIPVIPKVSCTSHRDVYTVCIFARAVGMSKDAISAGFAGWASAPDWIRLDNPEYLYLIYDINEDLVDFRRYFREARDAMDIIARSSALHEVRSSLCLYMAMMSFYERFDFAQCFNNNDAVVQEKIERLVVARRAAWESFLIDPYDPAILPQIIHMGCVHDVWSHEGISVVPTPQMGHPVLVTATEVAARWAEFTVGMLDAPLEGPPREFPYDNVVFAGGAVSKVVGVNYDPVNALQSDVDMFIIGTNYEERARTVKQVLSWFESTEERPRTFYALHGSVATIYIRDVERKFQIISGNYTNPYDVIGRFDLSHIQWCMWKHRVYGTSEAILAAVERMTRINNASRLRTDRLVKALHCGYHIQKAPRVTDCVDLTGLLEDKSPESPLATLISSFFGWYYPQSRPRLPASTEKAHILEMIRKDARATIVNTAADIISSNIVVGGNFDSDYNAVSYRTFNPATLIHAAVGRGVMRMTLRAISGIVRLTTPIMKVVRCVSDDEGIVVTVHITEHEFADFCVFLENTVYRMYRQAAVTERLVNDDGDITFTVPRRVLELQAQRGLSVIRSQRGEALDIEEDLRPDDDIQVLFTIDLHMYPEERTVRFKPVKFIKHQAYTIEAAARIVTTGQDLDDEVAQLLRDAEAQPEPLPIVYEEI